MKYPWIDEYLMAKNGVTKDIQAEWNWMQYHIGGKTFSSVLLDDHNLPDYINLKLEPVKCKLMQQQYQDIIPGYGCYLLPLLPLLYRAWLSGTDKNFL